jgi:uncharacterized phiE125 gp8 family phage protein
MRHSSRPTLQSLSVTSAPARDAITLEEAKRTARVDFDDTDDEISDLISGATEWLEEHTGRSLITRTLRAVYSLPTLPESALRGLYARLDAELSFQLYRTPLQSVSLVEIESDLETWQALTVTSDYVVDSSSDPAHVVLRSAALSAWAPVLTLYSLTRSPRVRITYIAGYGDTPASVPGNFKRALRGVVAAQYDDPMCAPDTSLLDGLDSVRNV